MTLLICPSCGGRYPASERFCASCRVPLVFAAEDSGDVPVSERHQRARKVKPQLAEQKYPATFREVAEMGKEYLDRKTFEELVRWIDSLDKF